MKTHLFIVIAIVLGVVALSGCSAMVSFHQPLPSVNVYSSLFQGDYVGIDNPSMYDQDITVEYSDGGLALQTFRLLSHAHVRAARPR